MNFKELVVQNIFAAVHIKLANTDMQNAPTYSCKQKNSEVKDKLKERVKDLQKGAGMLREFSLLRK